MKTIYHSVLAALMISCGCSPSLPTTPISPPAATAPRPDDRPLSEREKALALAIERAAAYLVRATGPTGKMQYRINLDPAIHVRDGYNILRHAGSMYALAERNIDRPTPEASAALGRAARYLEAHIAPLAAEPSLLAVWSTTKHVEAKLGGSGLALVALSTLAKSHPQIVQTERLKKVVNFVGFLQKPDGSFHSKYFRGSGPDDSWTSLYYPGEAALGTVLFAEASDDPRGVEIAARALRFLARSRRGQARVPPDHWALIATRELLKKRSAMSPDERSELVFHARQICEELLANRYDHPSGAALRGCFGKMGRTTPTATRLEGLIAALDFLDPQTDAGLIAHIRVAVEEGVDFLARAQIAEGPHAGAVPGAMHRRVDEPGNSKFNAAATEVRIDYVQHAMSAWMGYLKLR